MFRAACSALLVGVLCGSGGFAGDRESDGGSDNSGGSSGSSATTIEFPDPRTDSRTSLEQALEARRSIRDFSAEPLSKDQLGQLLWAAQGITDEASGFRTAPSAGATYPIEVYVAVGRVTDLSDGLYRYDPDGHQLHLIDESDQRGALHEAALSQSPLADPPVTIAISAVVSRTAGRYGVRAERYVKLEAGHVSQNVYLQAQALGLGTVAVGAFDDDSVSAILELEEETLPLYLMPVGVSR